MNKRVLFVDDELNIRLTFSEILKSKGFGVSVASSVPDALQMIQSQAFDILLSDLNIGQPGDGFTVVSAMRRVQPQARTFILTGYPDFASALTAIRNQVDDYFTKPADIEKIIEAFAREAPFANSERNVPLKRISAILRENQEHICEQWLTRCLSNPELAQVRLSSQERVDHIPNLLVEIADRIDKHPEKLSSMAVATGRQNGIVRYEQGYTIPMLLVESSILEKTITELLQQHLLSIDVSTLIPDMHQMSEAVNCAAETAVRAYLELLSDPKAV